MAEAGQGLGPDFVGERANTSLNPDTGRGEAWLSGPPAPRPARRGKEDSQGGAWRRGLRLFFFFVLLDKERFPCAFKS